MKKRKLLTLLGAAIVMLALAAAPVMADLASGVTLDFNANDSASGVSSSSWVSLTADQSRNWSFGGDVSLVDASSGFMSKAYRFTGGSGANASSWTNYDEAADATWELWVKPAGTGSGNQVIFESGGGGTGMAIYYDQGAGTINFLIDGGTPVGTVSAPIGTEEFSHVVCVYDKDFNTNDLMQIWVNGVLVDEYNDNSGIDKWSGTDGAGLGHVNTGVGSNISAGSFYGDLAVLRFWEAKALTEAEVTGNYALYASFGAEIIYPENGAVVPPGEVMFEWINLDPNGATETYVDVWFGTDPNKVTGPGAGTYTKVVNGESISSFALTPGGPGVYYWQVDSYTHGKPTTAGGTVDYSSGDPCMVAGGVNMFTNDGPIASVDAGPDMVTWFGEPVDLVADVNDDGGSALTYSWTADLPSGVTAVFDPSADAAVTSVTFAKGPYTNANIINAGFEADQQGEDGWGGSPGWTAIGRMGNWNPPDSAYDGSAVPEGVMCAWAQTRGNGLAQVLAETLAADTDYSLTVEVGNSNRYDWTGYKVQLLAGGVVIAEDDNTVSPAPGAFATSTVNYSYAPEDANKVGLPLEIRLIAGDQVPEGTYAECNFDAVQLSADPAFPTPEGVSTVDVTLTVNDVLNPAESDTMTIEIYDDACQAARLGFGAGSDADYNVNCQVYPEDLATMAAIWLSDTTAKEPVQADPQPGQLDGPIVLFADTFNRSNSTDLNASTDGKSGSRGSLNYVTRSFNSRVDINNNALLIDSDDSDGHHGGLVYIENHNFVDSEIASSGNFSVSVDITQYSTAGSGRFMFVSVGQSLAELEAKTGVGGGGDCVADLNVGYRNTTDSLEIFNGSVMDPNASVVGGLPDAVTTMRIDFTLPDFNAGSTVEYSVYFDGSTEAFTSGTFTWSGTDENYISLSSNLTGNSRFDNLEISYEPTGSVQADAGDGWSTWLGKEVTMSPTVSDSEDAGALFDYNWTAEAMGGLDVAISDPTAEAPDVTVTRVVPFWWEIPIENPSFEDNVLADPDGRYGWFATSRSTWRFADPDGTAFTTSDNKGYWGQMFLWNPGAEDLGLNWNGPGFNGEVPDGVNCVIVGSILRSGAVGPVPASEYPGGLAQLLTMTYDPTASYELSAYIGHSDLTFSMQGGYRVELLAGGSNENSSSQYTHKVVGGTVIGSVESTDPIDAETWIPVTVPVAANAANADLAGEPLQIRITSLKIPDDPNTTYIEVDNVKLMTDAPKALEPVKMTLTVNKQGESDTISDSVMIDVYEDGCELVKAVDPAKIDVTDHNIDCITNLTDFAVLASDWLKDYALTSPQAKQ